MTLDHFPDADQADQQEQHEPTTPGRYDGHRSRDDVPEADVLDQEIPVQGEDEAAEEESGPRASDDEPEWT